MRSSPPVAGQGGVEREQRRGASPWNESERTGSHLKYHCQINTRSLRFGLVSLCWQ